uniref:Uncharacterized protein n=1 Tax=Odontella aurita TaxID=265563 RepID=A0A7S4JLF7_9STRA|mmetsp:Transcript_48870/g.147252  ORF Transcript_48870/g.147252 Transcript_48870/m.147252 type:complete len:124 (+) Transcript_48870:177-548(+)
MKTFTALALLSLSTSASAAAFVPSAPQSRAFSLPPLSAAAPETTPELEAAIADVRECASAFGEETAHFANMWIDKMLEGKQDGAAAGLLDECLLDDEDNKCLQFEEALTKLDGLLGVGSKEQF